MRAVDYPFDIPTSSFVFHPGTGSAVPFEAADVDADGRVAVLAVGSNASPSQLRRKFPAETLAVEARPVALHALTTEGRRFPSWDQHTILEHVAVPMAVTVEEFVDRVVSVTGFREQVDDHLRGRGLHW